MVLTSNISGYSVEGFSFEKSFDTDAFLQWLGEHWTSSFGYSLVYVILIFGLKYYMRDKPKFDLRYTLAAWSGILAVFSICGAIRTVPELVYVLKKYGLDYSVCNPSYYYGPTGIWAYLFVISKVYELGDTVFVVLRKQPLIFLHWYHHVTVLVYVWYSYTDHTAPGRWYSVMNYTVHSFMYSYYTCRALRFRFPKPVSMFITSIQIAQMIMGMYVAIRAYNHKTSGEYCQMSFENMRYCLIMYASYFILFAFFFHSAYLKKRSHTPPEPEAKKIDCKNHLHMESNGIAKMNGIISKKVQ